MPKVAIKQTEPEVPTEIMADAIVAICQGVRKLRLGRLNDKALLLLIQNATPGNVPQRAIKAVLDGIDNLERMYLRKKL